MKSNYHSKKTIRYMGNKNRLLDFIIPEIEKITSAGDVICDLMCGTCAISYALKERNVIYSNDIQYYSYVIANALIENNQNKINSMEAKRDLEKDFDYNMKFQDEKFFFENYADTYFSKLQCKEIDSLRYAINSIKNNYKKNLYLTALMYSMSICQSTSGHFAQYLPKNHKRLVSIREKSIWKEFIKKSDDFSDLVLSNFDNKAFNLDYKELLKSPVFNKVDCVYIDTPYTGEQYSRFYHILETVTLNDEPKLEYKGLYRDDRYRSNFSLRTKAKDEFVTMIKTLSKMQKKVVLSYSSSGIVSVEELEYLFFKNFKHYEMKIKKYNHSTQGKGSVKIKEYLFIGYN